MATTEQVMASLVTVAKNRRATLRELDAAAQWVDLMKKTGIPGETELTERRFKTVVQPKPAGWNQQN